MIDLSQKYALFAHTNRYFRILASKKLIPLHRQKQIYV